MLLAAAQIGFALGVMGHVQCAFAAQLAVDAVFIDQAEYQRGRGTEHAIELATDRFPETGFNIIRRDPHPGVNQSYVTTRTAMPGAMRFEHTYTFALLKQMDGG